MRFLGTDKCESVHLDVIHKGSGPQWEGKNTLNVMNVPFFSYPLSPSSLIFCQHKLWRVTHGNKEAEREVILLAACRSNNLFLWSFWVLTYSKGGTAQCFKVNTEVLFSSAHSWKSRVPQSLKAPVSVCCTVCVCVCVCACKFLFVFVHMLSFFLSVCTHAPAI